ncbi:MAG: hypothetical protein FWD15_06170 [Alphaproteobacteria bacterium]|nr:hypothetical protein [Alphaproteobacteria bacterium]
MKSGNIFRTAATLLAAAAVLAIPSSTEADNGAKTKKNLGGDKPVPTAPAIRKDIPLEAWPLPAMNLAFPNPPVKKGDTLTYLSEGELVRHDGSYIYVNHLKKKGDKNRLVLALVDVQSVYGARDGGGFARGRYSVMKDGRNFVIDYHASTIALMERGIIVEMMAFDPVKETGRVMMTRLVRKPDGTFEIDVVGSYPIPEGQYFYKTDNGKRYSLIKGIFEEQEALLGGQIPQRRRSR